MVSELFDNNNNNNNTLPIINVNVHDQKSDPYTGYIEKCLQ